MNAAEYVALREDRGAAVRRISDGWLVTCPAHADRTPSLHVTEGQDGRVLLSCQADCPTDAVIAADGLEYPSLFPDSSRGNGRVEVAAYRYIDENAAPLFEVVRFEPKDFRQRRADGTWGIKDVRRVLYRLPQVIEAVKAGRRVWIPEGEKDVHALERAGVVATCNPGGAGKWRTEYAAPLAGADVVVIADNDEPGLKHAREVIASLHGVAAKVVLARCPNGRKDAAEHLAAGGTLSELEPLEDTLGATANGAGPGAAASQPSDAVLAIRRALLDEAQDTRQADGPARVEVPGTGGLLHRGVAALIFGERGQGKSSVGVMIGMGAAAAGERVLLLDRENGAALTHERIEAILEANPGWGDPLADERFVGKHYPELRGDWRAEDVAEAIAGLGFTVAMFDSLREMLTALAFNPNDDADVSMFWSLAVTPLLRRGLSVAIFDNVGHTETHRPKGSGTKLDAAQQAYKVTTSARFTAVECGRIAIACSRSRFGDLDREWSMRVGGGVWEIPEPSTESPEARRFRRDRETRETFRLTCIAALAEKRPQGRDALVAAARKRGVKRRNDTLRGWLGELAADPASGIESCEAGYDLTPDPTGRGQVGVTPPEAPPDPLTLPVGGSWVEGLDPGARVIPAAVGGESETPEAISEELADEAVRRFGGDQ